MMITKNQLLDLHSQIRETKLVNKYYTLAGFNALTTRLKTLIELWEDEGSGETNTYPIKKMMLGFPTLQIENRTEHLHKISECFDTLRV